MPNLTISSSNQFADEDREIWKNLKQAIATSSGFQRWQRERVFEESPETSNLDSRVRRYLRETLETLAY